MKKIVLGLGLLSICLSGFAYYANSIEYGVIKDSNSISGVRTFKFLVYPPNQFRPYMSCNGYPEENICNIGVNNSCSIKCVGSSWELLNGPIQTNFIVAIEDLTTGQLTKCDAPYLYSPVFAPLNQHHVYLIKQDKPGSLECIKMY